MNSLSLLRAMILKETRTTFRERSQITGVAISVLILMLVIGSAFVQQRGHPHHPKKGPGVVKIVSGMAAENVPTAAVRWIAIGIATGAGFLFSMGYLISAVLASFVGEKEAKTLEILLASPLSDAKLFAAKCISALLPSACIGFGIACLIALLVGTLAPDDSVRLSGSALVFAVLLMLPILVLVQLWFVGMGAAISVRSETMKGSGQIFGVVFMVIFFGAGYGGPLLWQFVPSVRVPVMHFVTAWLAMRFASQYGSVLLLFGVPAIIFLAIGRASFRRDRMLT
ncbi:MAG TPA: ABC transporter permease [Tepidisphaeraceae bacterium]|nr:ABC transporter permease [Tepidisphaeraceae bacterium]